MALPVWAVSCDTALGSAGFFFGTGAEQAFANTFLRLWRSSSWLSLAVFGLGVFDRSSSGFWISELVGALGIPVFASSSCGGTLGGACRSSGVIGPNPVADAFVLAWTADKAVAVIASGFGIVAVASLETPESESESTKSDVAGKTETNDKVLRIFTGLSAVGLAGDAAAVAGAEELVGVALLFGVSLARVLLRPPPLGRLMIFGWVVAACAFWLASDSAAENCPVDPELGIAGFTGGVVLAIWGMPTITNVP